MNKTIICDTREKGNKEILDYFASINQDYKIAKLDAGDYMIEGEPEIIIDKKDTLLEICSNLTGKKKKANGTYERNRERLKREVERAHNLGCKEFIFLIQDDTINSINDVAKWYSRLTRVSGKQLYGIMKQFKENNDCKFLIVKPQDMGKTIIDLLTKK